MLEVMGLGSLATENAVNAAIGAIRDLLNGAVDFRLLLSQAAPYSNRKKAPEMIRKNASLGPRAGWVGSALAVLLLAGTAQGKIEGVSYTLTPSVEMQNAPEELGLEDTTLWGGKLSLNFGRFVGLESHYFTRNGVATSLGSTSLLDSLGMPLSDQKIDMRSYGSGLVFHLASGRTVPFLKLGGGVLELRGDDGETAKQIELRAGGGIKFGFERVQARIYVEDAMVRLDRYALAASDSGEVFPADPDARKLRHRLVLGAGIDIGLGGYTGVELTDTDRAIVERYRTGLR
ncbi:MAG: hypothetical protein KC591_08990, partial [Gemmatimonadetes bacterium]|nr:hypothetical protein [Gemmatimonadota bacterium]